MPIQRVRVKDLASRVTRDLVMATAVTFRAQKPNAHKIYAVFSIVTATQFRLVQMIKVATTVRVLPLAIAP